MLGQIYEKGEHNDVAARYYSRIVKDYPLSPLAGDSKNKLVKFGVPVPPADPTAVARMQKEQSSDRPNMLKRSMGILKTGPDVSTAAHNGAPTMTPASESGDETIGFSLQPNAGQSTPTSSIGSSAAVETITPGSPDALPQPTAATPGAASAATDSTQSADPNASGDANTAQPATPALPANVTQESSSKKKSKLRKVIPF
jgi:hypothetical protein